MSQFKISIRLFVLVSVLGGLLFLVGGIGLFGMKQADKSLESVYVDHAIGLSLLNEVEFQALRNRLTLSNAARDPSPERIQKYTERVDKSIPEMLAGFQNFMRGNLEAEDRQLAKLYGDALQKYVEAGLRPNMAALRANDIPLAHQLLDKSTGVLYDEVHALGVKLINLQLADGKKTYEASQQRNSLLQTIAMTSILLGLLFAVIFGYQLMRAITTPLGKAAQVTEAIAQGDLTQTVEITGNDEISVLLRAVAKMQASLAKVVSNVRHGSESVATASSE
ncbi:MAG: methyl-accepting chemotaxis protein I serine sensor receptor, partial [Comamonadaceae bacterium]